VPDADRQKNKKQTKSWTYAKNWRTKNRQGAGSANSGAYYIPVLTPDATLLTKELIVVNCSYRRLQQQLKSKKMKIILVHSTKNIE